MPSVNTQGGAQGWSQIRENLLNQQGTIKEKTVGGQTQLYVSNKWSNPFKDKTAHLVKLGGGMAAVKQALTNEYGPKFANMAFEKLSAGHRGPMTSLNRQDLQRLDQMTRVADRFAAKEFNAENTNFLKAVTDFRSKGADQTAAAFTNLYNTFMSDGGEQSINIPSSLRLQISALFEQTREGANEQQLASMKDLVGKAAHEIALMIDADTMRRLGDSAEWRRG